jgi:hypothetical protein
MRIMYHKLFYKCCVKYLLYVDSYKYDAGVKLGLHKHTHM